MTKIEFSAKEAASLQAHFAREKERLTTELAHVELMLSKLGTPSKKATTKAGLTPKKRGPKSIWGAFILKRLRARNRPMSYDELIADAMSIHKIPEARLKSAKASILNNTITSMRNQTCFYKVRSSEGNRKGRKNNNNIKLGTETGVGLNPRFVAHLGRHTP